MMMEERERVRSKSMVAIDRVGRLDEEMQRVSSGLSTLVQALEKLQKEVVAVLEEGGGGGGGGGGEHAGGGDGAGRYELAYVCHKVLGECFSFMREARHGGVGSSSSAGGRRRPHRRPYVQVQQHHPHDEELHDDSERLDSRTPPRRPGSLGGEERVIDVV
jgi:hypothetical protein